MPGTAIIIDSTALQITEVPGIAAFPFLNGNNKYTVMTKLNFGVLFFTWLHLEPRTRDA